MTLPWSGARLVISLSMIFLHAPTAKHRSAAAAEVVRAERIISTQSTPAHKSHRHGHANRSYRSLGGRVSDLGLEGQGKRNLRPGDQANHRKLAGFTLFMPMRLQSGRNTWKLDPWG